jgi:hypothetical protein
MNDNIPANRASVPSDIVDPDQLIRVEDGLLVVPSGCVLPQVCVRTNESVSENDMILTNLFWCPRAMLPIILVLSPMVAFMAFMFSHNCCEITYGLSPSLRRRSIYRRATCSILAIVLLVAAVFFADPQYSAWLPVATAILFVAALIAAVANGSHLSVVKCRNGMFWVKGLRPDYLAQLPLEA